MADDEDGVLLGTFIARPSTESVAAVSESWQQDFRSEAGDLVFFGEGSAELGARARIVLAAQADWLRGVPEGRILIEGHADDPGGLAVNRELSLQRADAVRRRLIETGVAPERITIEAHGNDRPVALCAGPVCAAQNRRTVSIVGPASALKVAADAVRNEHRTPGSRQDR